MQNRMMRFLVSAMSGMAVLTLSEQLRQQVIIGNGFAVRFDTDNVFTLDAGIDVSVKTVYCKI